MAETKKLSSKRAFELDMLRGFSIFMMILHHFAYDLRYILEYDVFPFIGGNCVWFWAFLHPFFIMLFVGISGVCCQFSRNNFKRALKLGLVAIVFSAATITADHFLDLGCTVYFNVLHMLTVATFLFAVFDHVERKKTDSRESRTGSMILCAIVMLCFFVFNALQSYQYTIKSKWVFILGLAPHPSVDEFIMGDELALFPWLGVFFVGVLIGRFAYKNKETLFPRTPKPVLMAVKPFEWIGRNSLLVYLVHQPILLGILYGLRALGIIP